MYDILINCLLYVGLAVAFYIIPIFITILCHKLINEPIDDSEIVQTLFPVWNIVVALFNFGYTFAYLVCSAIFSVYCHILESDFIRKISDFVNR